MCVLDMVDWNFFVGQISILVSDLLPTWAGKHYKVEHKLESLRNSPLTRMCVGLHGSALSVEFIPIPDLNVLNIVKDECLLIRNAPLKQ